LRVYAEQVRGRDIPKTLRRYQKLVIPVAMVRALDTAGKIVAEEVQKQMYGERTRAARGGRTAGVYKKSKRKGKFDTYKRVSNLPSHVLAIDSKRLRASIGNKSHPEGIWRKGHSLLYYWIDIGTRVPYAGIHEFGGPFMAFGRYPAKMPKRPFFVPGIEKGIPKANKAIMLRFQRIF
jgi:phage gpG-like protein